MFAIGSESKLASVAANTPTPRFRAAHQLFAIHHNHILLAGTRAVGITLAVRTERNIATGILRDDLVEFRALDTVVVHNGTAAVRFYGCHVNSVRTHIEFRACLQRCKHSFLDIGTRRRFERAGIICWILSHLTAAFIGRLARLLPGLLL